MDDWERTAEWARLLGVSPVPVSSLTRADMPDGPGVYLWRKDGDPVYVGMGKSLRKRVWGKHLAGGLRLSGSSLRRNVCGQLFGIAPAETAGRGGLPVTREQSDAVRAWLRGCSLAWIVTESQAAADSYERALRRLHRLPLNRI